MYFFASLTASAEVGKKWHDLSFNLKGELLVKKGENDFGGIWAQKIANKANERITEAQEALTYVQNGLTTAQEKLTSAQTEVWKCNKAFDAAVNDMDKAKTKLEEAKGPYREALEKLNKAKKDVENLCKIRTCHGICVPGIRVRWCNGWIPYPCFSFTNCLFRIPNIQCHLANAACYVVRGLAYVALEAAKLFVRIPMLALDIAKGLVTAAQYVVDKSRVVLTIANGVLEIAKAGLETIKGAAEFARIALEGVKFVVRAAFHVFEMIIKYGLQNIIDVKNCEFELVLTTADKAEFDVSCEIKAFGLGWHRFSFEFDFRNPLVSMWNIARSTISTLIDILKDTFGKRKKRDISFMSMTKLHHILRIIKRDVGEGNSTNAYQNSSIFLEENISIYFRNRFTNRVEYFTYNCQIFLNIYSFLLESVNLLSDITNESASALNDLQHFRQRLDTMDMNITSTNFTAESFGISPEYALRDYNLTEEDIHDALNDVRDSIGNDDVLSQVSNSTNFAREVINSQLEEASLVSIIDHWLFGLGNHSGDYFNETECTGFQDCVLYSFFELYDIFSEKNMINSTQNQNLTSTIEDEFQSLLHNRSRSIEDSHKLSNQIIRNLHLLNESNAFCSQAPTIHTIRQNITVLAGSQIFLKCLAKGDPTPIIEWYHRNAILHDKNIEYLLLNNVSDLQNGLYKCKAENIVTNVSSDIADITVIECPPGTYYKNESCTDCVRGYYQTEWNQKTCKACPKGYTTDTTRSTDITFCSDIDECSVGLMSMCEQKCINTNGSYGCGCNEGYVLSNDGKSCNTQNDILPVKIAAGVVGGFACLIIIMFVIWKVNQTKHVKIRPQFSNGHNDSKASIDSSWQRWVSNLDKSQY